MQHWIPAPAEALADLLDFTPVPRKKRAGGWTAERQRGFIAALAETGSVKAAARAVNMSPEGAYHLRRQPGAEGFVEAWRRAQASGMQRLTDIAIERATEGVAVPVFYKGEQVGERRAYNDRLLMFLMRQNGPGGAPIGACAPATAPAPTPAQKQADHQAALHDVAVWLQQLFERYAAKVRAERRHRLAGEILAADFTLRQLTHIELILDLGGRSAELLRFYTNDCDPGATRMGRIVASPLSEKLDEVRRDTWDAMGDPPRPALDLRPHPPSRSCVGLGDTEAERVEARREAERRIAAAQAMWEAAATEEDWARWRGLGGGVIH